MIEIQALQTRQKEEIESLFTRMGKPPPPSVLSPAVAMTGGRRRRKSHRSSRNSGQPSPIHSGTYGELRPQLCDRGLGSCSDVLFWVFFFTKANRLWDIM